MHPCNSVFLFLTVRKTFYLFSFEIFQHPLMPPYGTPVPYPVIYPPGGVYAHPPMATVKVTMLSVNHLLIIQCAQIPFSIPGSFHH